MIRSHSLSRLPLGSKILETDIFSALAFLVFHILVAVGRRYAVLSNPGPKCRSMEVFWEQDQRLA